MNEVKFHLNEPLTHEFITAGKEQALYIVFLKVIYNSVVHY
jgi:hypothetical protein